MIPEVILSIVGGFGANVLLTLLGAVRGWLEARRKLKEAEEANFQAALASGSLLELGGYLDGPIASFLVREYAGNPSVRQRVDTLLARIEEYVGTAADVPKEPTAPSLIAESPSRASASEFDDVQVRLDEGRLWDALAVLRRLIEKRLLALARKAGLMLPDRIGAGKLLQLLRQRELIHDDAANGLRYAIDVANRGVHGLDVTAEEVFGAVLYARRALDAIGRGIQSGY